MKSSPFKASDDEDGFFSHIGIIGIGLVGSSLARAIGKKLPRVKLYGLDISNTNVKLAKASSLFEGVALEAEELTQVLDLLILAVPLSQMAPVLKTAEHLIGPHTLITDVGSVKTPIQQHFEASCYASQFIGGHPMAGSEKAGFEHGREDLFLGAKYFLCPSQNQLKKSAFRSLEKLICSIGAVPVVTTSQEHDSLVASLSHMPHLTACALVSSLIKNHSPEALNFAGGGFRDMTRIAMSDGQLWNDIFKDNKNQVLNSLDALLEELNQLKTWIKTDESLALVKALDASKQVREAIK